MHELSIANAIVDAAGRHAEGRRVSVVGIRVGHLRQVVPSSLRFYWKAATAGTVCERARLELEEVAAELACADCGERWEPELPVFRCPACGSRTVELAAGDELTVEYIEVENEEAACIARE